MAYGSCDSTIVVDLVKTDVRVALDEEADIVVARQQGRTLAEQLGLSTSQQTMIATAISEIARNIIVYAGQGEVRLSVVEDGQGRRGVQMVARDCGPGIDDIALAMRDGYSTAGSLGLGLPGARRLMDDFEIMSSSRGTTVTMCKWQPAPP